MFLKKNLIYYINIFFILSIWFCIDTNFENVLGTPSSSPYGYDYMVKFFFINDINIKNIFFSIRALSPFLFFIILLFLSYFYQFKIKFLTKNKTLNFILIIFYFNFLFQAIGLLTTDNHIFNSYYIFVSLLFL